MTPLGKSKAPLCIIAEECNSLASLISEDEEEMENGVGTKRRRQRQVVPIVKFGTMEIDMPVITLGCMIFQQSRSRGGVDNDVVDSLKKEEEECQQNLVNILRYAIRLGVNHIETERGYGISEM